MVGLLSAEDLKGYVVDQRDKGRFLLNSAVYLDQKIFQAEMEAIFHRSWVYLAHESQISHPNDYLTLHVGLQPVILTRDENGKLCCMFNRCRHRGSLVCRADQGNSSRFRCIYHGWTYKNDGRLIGVTDRDGYPPDFELESLGLEPVPRLGSYKGFVFASTSPDGPSLEEHLGNSKAYIDIIVDKFPDGIEVIKGVQKYGYPGNWKLQVENALDHYHAPFVHKSWFEALGIKQGTRMDLRSDDYAIYLGKGHGLDLMLREHGLYGEDTELTEYSKRKEFTQRLSPLQLKWARKISFHLLVFPNMVIFDTASPAPHIRVVRPLSVDKTEVSGYCYLPVGAKPDARAKMLKAYEDFFGPASMGTPDDIEVLKSCTEGYGATAAPFNDLSRGIHREHTDLEIKELSAFEVAGNGTDDTVYRGIYRWWSKMMSQV